MPSKEELRQIIRTRQNELAAGINAALRGETLDLIEPILSRIGRGGVLPHWYENL